MKNTIYVIVIVVCLLLAIVIFIKSRSGGSGGLDSIKRGEEMYWVMCNNPKCKEAYEIDKKDYFTDLEEKLRANPMSMRTPPLTCKKCGENSVYRAFKCPKCGHLFFRREDGGFEDRCPECGFSKMEDDRAKAREARKAG